MLEYIPKGELSKDISRFGSFTNKRASTVRMINIFYIIKLYFLFNVFL